MFDTYFAMISTLWTNFHAWHPAYMVLYTIVGMSLVAAILLSRIIGKTSLITVPSSFVILFYSALLLNFGGLSIPMTETSEIQKAMIFSVLGHFMGGVMVLGIFKAASR